MIEWKPPVPGPKAGMQIGAMASFTEDQGMKKNTF